MSSKTDTDSETKYDFNSFMRMWLPMLIAVISVLLNGVFWVQNTNDEQYYAKLSGENLESKVRDLKDDMKIIRDQNDEISVMLGRIEGRLDEQQRHESGK